MATVTVKRGKQPSAAEAIEPETPAGGEGEQEFTPDDVAVLDLLGELGGDADTVIRVYRQGKGGYRDLTLINECGIGEFTPIMLAHPPYNGGVFRIHARSKGGITLNRELKVEPAPQITQPAQAAQPQGLAAMTPEILAMTIAQAVRAAMPAAPAVDPMTSMERAIGLITPLLAAQRHDPAPAPAQDPFKVMDSVINMASRMNEMRGDGGGDGGGMGMMSTLVREFAPMLKDVLARHPAAAADVAAQLGQMSQPQIAAPAIQPPAQSTSEDDVSFKLKMGLSFLVTQAKADNDPQTYAHMIIDNAPDADLRQLFGAPDWLDKLAVFAPEVKAYPEWFTEMKAVIQDIWNAPPDESANTLPPADTKTDTPPPANS